jgi:UrcA family protein
MRTPTLAPLIALALALGATTAGAAPAAPKAAEQISIRVQVADLDLESPTGAALALQRIHKAALAICGDASGVRDLRRQALSDTCVRKAVTATVASASSPALAALNGSPVATTTIAAAN